MGNGGAKEKKRAEKRFRGSWEIRGGSGMEEMSKRRKRGRGKVV